LPSKKNPAKGIQKLRIIGGQWRSRQISFATAPGLRPTGDRIRETLFNWLAPYVPGAQCLDLFAGSGALGFEAVSRGAAGCIALELHRVAAGQLRDNKRQLGADQLTILETDAMQYLQHNTNQQTFDIVFVDPPFDGDYQSSVCTLLQDNRWLADGAFIYCEFPVANSQFDCPANWRQLREKISGGVKYALYSQIEPSA
jgi:16S rRNA (guanine966-N2)-methyltransferase